MPSIREQILDAIRTEIKKIDGTGSFEITVDQVVDYDVSPTDFPGASVVVGVMSGAQESNTQGGMPVSSIVTDNILIVIAACFVVGALTVVRARMDKLAAAIAKTVFDDNTLGVSGARALNRTFSETKVFPEGEGGSAFMEVRIEVRYVSSLDEL